MGMICAVIPGYDSREGNMPVVSGHKICIRHSWKHMSLRYRIEHFKNNYSFDIQNPCNKRIFKLNFFILFSLPKWWCIMKSTISWSGPGLFRRNIPGPGCSRLLELLKDEGKALAKAFLLFMEEIRLTTWDVQNLVNHGINYLSTGAGFFPSTVTLPTTNRALKIDLPNRKSHLPTIHFQDAR